MPNTQAARKLHTASIIPLHRPAPVPTPARTVQNHMVLQHGGTYTPRHSCVVVECGHCQHQHLALVWVTKEGNTNQVRLRFYDPRRAPLALKELAVGVARGAPNKWEPRWLARLGTTQLLGFALLACAAALAAKCLVG